MNALYNEIEPYAASWLENLSGANRIAAGRVERRSIRELGADDVREATQFHAFAGIGVWSYVLRLAGWPDNRPAWTGSCPCQPFSQAGKRGGVTDERHLWPEWFRLIRECRPPVVFGEQVASADGLAWLDAVCADLEGAGYAVGAADLCAAGVGAPHLRQRLFFVAYANGGTRGQGRSLDNGCDSRGDAQSRAGSGGSFGVGDVAHTESERGRGLLLQQRRQEQQDADTLRGGEARDLGNASGERSGREPRRVADQPRVAGAVNGFWRDAEWIECLDGKRRAIEPGTFPLAHGAAARVGRLRAYGNAIVAPVAAEFVKAAMEAIYVYE